MAMAETGYRYVELYWGGFDEIWEYAEYQVDKIKLAISNGFERRPLRKESGKHFMNNVLPEMKSAVGKKDSSDFFRTFEIMTTNCNACHALEKVPFFNIKIPETRKSPVKKYNGNYHHRTSRFCSFPPYLFFGIWLRNFITSCFCFFLSD